DQQRLTVALRRRAVLRERSDRYQRGRQERESKTPMRRARSHGTIRPRPHLEPDYLPDLVRYVVKPCDFSFMSRIARPIQQPPHLSWARPTSLPATTRAA